MDYTVCIVIRHPPYGTVLPAEAYRTIQALQTFEREVNVLFVADGALTLVESTDPEPIGMHCLADAFVDLLALPGVSLAV
ncbi:MAG: DsrE family protein, partial [Thermoplasmata archaeon]